MLPTRSILVGLILLLGLAKLAAMDSNATVAVQRENCTTSEDSPEPSSQNSNPTSSSARGIGDNFMQSVMQGFRLDVAERLRLDLGERLKEGWKEIEKKNPLLSVIEKLTNTTKEIFTTTTTTTSTTTTTTTTTPTPIEDLTKTIASIPSQIMPSSKLLETPAKVFNSVLQSSLSMPKLGVDTVDTAAEGLLKVTKHTGKVVGDLSGLKLKTDPEPDRVYYEYSSNDEHDGVKKPKYFSKQCNFRLACEVGKIVSPVSGPVKPALERNKFIQDLQNRYTRAFTYGMLRGDCSRYYCLIVQLFGGPTGFAKGVSELINRTVNPDLYEGSS